MSRANNRGRDQHRLAAVGSEMGEAFEQTHPGLMVNDR
jgi:hypothetical protein